MIKLQALYAYRMSKSILHRDYINFRSILI